MLFFAYTELGDTMRMRLHMLFLLIVMICTFTFLKVRGQELPLLGKIIYLDAGHGGVDSGAVYKDILEKDINLSIVSLLASKLESLGATVYLTRYGDYDLSTIGAYYRKQSDLYNRAKMINESDADIYLSIHLNSTTSSTWSGAQVFYDDICEENITLATYVKNALGTTREVSEITDMYFNKRVEKPGILIEAGFLSNSHDRYLLQQEEYQEELVDKIIVGVTNYFDHENYT